MVLAGKGSEERKGSANEGVWRARDRGDGVRCIQPHVVDLLLICTCCELNPHFNVHPAAEITTSEIIF